MSYQFGLQVAQIPEADVPALVRSTTSPWVISWRWRLVLALRASPLLEQEARSDFFLGPAAAAFALPTHTATPAQLPLVEVARYGTAADLRNVPAAALRASSPTTPSTPPRLSERNRALLAALQAGNLATTGELLREPDGSTLRIIVAPLMEALLLHPEMALAVVDQVVQSGHAARVQEGPRALLQEWELLLTPWIMVDPRTRIPQLRELGFRRFDFLQGGLTLTDLDGLIHRLGRETVMEYGLATPAQLAGLEMARRIQARALAAVLPRSLLGYVLSAL